MKCTGMVFIKCFDNCLSMIVCLTCCQSAKVCVRAAPAKIFTLGLSTMGQSSAIFEGGQCLGYGGSNLPLKTPISAPMEFLGKFLRNLPLVTPPSNRPRLYFYFS